MEAKYKDSPGLWPRACWISWMRCAMWLLLIVFFNIKAMAWEGRPCSTAYSKAVATLSQRCRNAVAIFSMFWWKSPNHTKRLARAQKRPVLLTPILLPIMTSLVKQTKNKTHKHSQAKVFFIYMFFYIPRIGFF